MLFKKDKASSWKEEINFRMNYTDECQMRSFRIMIFINFFKVLFVLLSKPLQFPSDDIFRFYFHLSYCKIKQLEFKFKLSP